MADKNSCSKTNIKNASGSVVMSCAECNMTIIFEERSQPDETGCADRGFCD